MFGQRWLWHLWAPRPQTSYVRPPLLFAANLYQLPNLYSDGHIRAYDVTALNFGTTARVLASEIPMDFSVSSYLDLGTRTGLTAVVCGEALLSSGHYFHLLLAGGLDEMLNRALTKLHNKLNPPHEHCKTGLPHKSGGPGGGCVPYCSLRNLPLRLQEIYLLETRQRYLISSITTEISSLLETCTTEYLLLPTLK